MEIGFDNEKYLEEQSKYILERVSKYDKLYLEFGGKLFNDFHAKRVLPNYDENVKVRLLKKIKDISEVIVCIYSEDIENDRIRKDYNITYSEDSINLINNLKNEDLNVNSVVITRYYSTPKIDKFIKMLEENDIIVYKYRYLKDYPHNINLVVSENGFGKNPYIETTKPIVIVTASGANSGKLTTCLCQLYHEQLRGINVGYSKFETFPVWDLPLNHPLNVAYESATMNINDKNMIDVFHEKAYGEKVVNYNRDIEAFPILQSIMSKIVGKENAYKSPTDMGVNRISTGIIDDKVIKQASLKEIKNRCNAIFTNYKKGKETKTMYNRAKKVLSKIKPNEYLSWDEYFMNIAILTSQRSKDMNTKVGACIIDENNKIVATGYNGFVSGCDNDDFPNNREGEWINTKYPYIVHAEANSIFNSHGTNLEGCTIYATLFPCNECAKAIVQSGIKHIVYLEDKYIGEDNNIASKRILDMVGVEYEQYQGNKVIRNLS